MMVGTTKPDQALDYNLVLTDKQLQLHHPQRQKILCLVIMIICILKCFCNKTKVFIYTIDIFFIKGFSGNNNFNQKSKNIELKNCSNIEYFTVESTNIGNSFQTFFLQNNLRILSISNLKYRNHYLFFKFLILLSGDVNINPGPVHRAQGIDNSNEWEVF